MIREDSTTLISLIMMIRRKGLNRIERKASRKVNLPKRSKLKTTHKRGKRWKTLKIWKASLLLRLCLDQSSLCPHLLHVGEHRLQWLYLRSRHIHRIILDTIIEIIKIPMDIGRKFISASNLIISQMEIKIRIIFRHKIVKKTHNKDKDKGKWMCTWEIFLNITIKMINCWLSSRMRALFDKFDARNRPIARLLGFWKNNMQ